IAPSASCARTAVSSMSLRGACWRRRLWTGTSCGRSCGRRTYRPVTAIAAPKSGTSRPERPARRHPGAARMPHTILELAGAIPHVGEAAKARAFAEVLRRHPEEGHVAALQDYPDPDAIAAALAYRMLAARFGINVDILYEGRISHQENLALVHVLDIELTRFTESMPLDRYDGAIYIDNQGTTTRLADRLEKAGVPALAVF